MSVQQNILIQALPQHVWDTLIDFESRSLWSTRVSLARVIPSGSLRFASRIEIAVGADRSMYQVTDIQPPERLSLELQGHRFKSSRLYELRGTGGTTNLILTTEFGGIMGGAVGLVRGGSVRLDLVDELQAIRQAAEAGACSQTTKRRLA